MSPLEQTAHHDLTEQVVSWPAKARTASVTDGPSYEAAAELLKAIKALRAEVDQTFDRHIKNAHAAWKDLLAEKARHEQPLTDAETIIKRALVAYDQAQERQRRDEQRRLDELAKQQAQDDALARAAAMEAEGRDYGDASLVREAEMVVQEAIDMPPPPMAPIAPRTTPKVAGISMVTTWSCACTDLKALIAFVAAHPEHVNLLQFNQTAGNALARAQRENLRVPGLRAVATQGVAAGRR